MIKSSNLQPFLIAHTHNQPVIQKQAHRDRQPKPDIHNKRAESKRAREQESREQESKIAREQRTREQDGKRAENK